MPPSQAVRSTGTILLLLPCGRAGLGSVSQVQVTVALQLTLLFLSAARTVSVCLSIMVLAFSRTPQGHRQVAAAPGGRGGWCLGGLAGWEAFAVQNGLPVISPGVQAPAWGWQLDVPVVAAGEQDVLPARVRLHTCGKGGKAGISWGVAPQPAASHGNAVPTLDGVLVIKQQVSSHHGLVSGQNNPLHKLGSQVFLYPLILQRQGIAENPIVFSVCRSLMSDQP